MGTNDAVDKCSGSYVAGVVAGVALQTAIHRRGYKTGHEFAFGKNFRVAPWGNRRGNHPIGKYPHYHRRIFKPNGEVADYGSLNRHRPWEKGGW